MKLLACASYDYMKLMVHELQQQLAEIEEAERIEAEAAATGAADHAVVSPSSSVDFLSNGVAEDTAGEQQPKAPPRQRANPFNSAAGAKSSSNPGAAAAAAKKTWIGLHREFGVKIQSDRLAWQKARSAMAVA